MSTGCHSSTSGPPVFARRIACTIAVPSTICSRFPKPSSPGLSRGSTWMAGTRPAMTKRESRRTLAYRAFKREQALFGGEPASAAIAAHPAFRQYAMAGDDDRDRVLAASPTDSARRRADCLCELAIAAGLAKGDGLHRRPDAPFEP